MDLSEAAKLCHRVGLGFYHAKLNNYGSIEGGNGNGHFIFLVVFSGAYMSCVGERH